MKRKTANIDIRVEPQLVQKIDAWRARQRVPPSRSAAEKAFAGRVRRAEAAGWRWDQESFSSYGEQLERWEAEQTFERRFKRGGSLPVALLPD